MKKLIINADDFGYSLTVNEGIKQCYEAGIITSTSFISNLDGFENAKNDVLPQIEGIDIGFHFNIMEGQCLSKNELLCDTNGNFNNNFLNLILKSKNKKFKYALEEEFRLQIEKILAIHKISHIDSHVHTHSIPEIFKIIQKLSKEYDIKYIRTQRELPYLVKEKILSKKFPINCIKNILLNSFTTINKSNNIYTNDYFIGVLYTSYMDENAIIEGLKRIKKDNSITEIIFHPACTFNNEIVEQDRYNEFLLSQSKTIKDKIHLLGFELTSYSKL